MNMYTTSVCHLIYLILFWFIFTKHVLNDEDLHLHFVSTIIFRIPPENIPPSASFPNQGKVIWRLTMGPRNNFAPEIVEHTASKAWCGSDLVIPGVEEFEFDRKMYHLLCKTNTTTSSKFWLTTVMLVANALMLLLDEISFAFIE